MRLTTLAYWRYAAKQHAVWSTSLWALLFNALIAILVKLLGLATFVDAFTVLDNELKGLSVNRGQVFAAFVVIYLFALMAPFLLAGTCGLISQAVSGRSTKWATYWQFGFRFYGRAWGLILFGLLWASALAVCTLLGFWVAHAVGIVTAGVLALLTWPLVLRMLGGLFVDERPWVQSFRAVFQVRGYITLWEGGVLALLMSGVAFAGSIAMTQLAPMLGTMVYFLVNLAVIPISGSWILALYRAATRPIYNSSTALNE